MNMCTHCADLSLYPCAYRYSRQFLQESACGEAFGVLRLAEGGAFVGLVDAEVARPDAGGAVLVPKTSFQVGGKPVVRVVGDGRRTESGEV